ncbi:MAG: hypothetical protein LBJ69_03120 [Holosporales bacterium]|jgi:hypothetical protein|nr:hypothetical protein [Holosporales bacterium]
MCYRHGKCTRSPQSSRERESPVVERTGGGDDPVPVGGTGIYREINELKHVAATLATAVSTLQSTLNELQASMGQPAEGGENPVQAGGLYERLEAIERRLVQHDDLIGRPAAVYPDWHQNTIDTGLYRLNVATEARDKVYREALPYTEAYRNNPLLNATMCMMYYRRTYGDLRSTNSTNFIVSNPPNVLGWPVEAITLGEILSSSTTEYQWAYLCLEEAGTARHTFIMNDGTVLAGSAATARLREALISVQESTTPPTNKTSLMAAYGKYVPTLDDAYVMQNTYPHAMRQADPTTMRIIDDTRSGTAGGPSPSYESLRIQLELLWEKKT